MVDQYFGHKELYEVALRAKTPMQFGNRYIEADEPILYFDNVNILKEHLSSAPLENVTILIKGSNSNHLSTLVDAL